jgi:hypothetical protein
MAITFHRVLSFFALLLLPMYFASSRTAAQEHMDDKISSWSTPAPTVPRTGPISVSPTISTGTARSNPP